jgi:hypothetical protein
MTWEREPLGIRALPSQNRWKYAEVRRAVVCGCLGCLQMHWVWLARLPRIAFTKHDTGMTGACTFDPLVKYDDPKDTLNASKKRVEWEWQKSFGDML